MKAKWGGLLLSFRQSGQLYSITFHWITGHSTFGPCPRERNLQQPGRSLTRHEPNSAGWRRNGHGIALGFNTHGRTDVSASVPLLSMMTWCFVLGHRVHNVTTEPWRAFLRAILSLEPWSGWHVPLQWDARQKNIYLPSCLQNLYMTVSLVKENSLLLCP